MSSGEDRGRLSEARTRVLGRVLPEQNKSTPEDSYVKSRMAGNRPYGLRRFRFWVLLIYERV
jgi:hypothetical protein